MLMLDATVVSIRLLERLNWNVTFKTGVILSRSFLASEDKCGGSEERQTRRQEGEGEGAAILVRVSRSTSTSCFVRLKNAKK